jgi:kynurenine 3-monooxygenase
VSEKRITIVGGGLVGALMAKYLGLAGHRVALFERRPDIRDATVVRGRSINLAVSTRGLTALHEVGLRDKVLERAVPMRGRMIHSVAGELAYQPYSKDPAECIQSISRGALNQLLLEEADLHENVTLRFEQRCVDLDPESGRAFFLNESTGSVTESQADLVLGTDGAFSAVRLRLQKGERFDYAQSYLDAGYLELRIPPVEGGGFRLEREALHIWPRGKFMMIALPNHDGTFTVTCFWPIDGEHGFARLTNAAEVEAYFRKWFSDAVPLMPTLVEDYLTAKPSTLVTIRCSPWTVGRVTLLGDAAHAIVPFYGQGMNAGFEDCRVLNRLLTESPGDWPGALARFAAERKPNADAIADLAVENFHEMRDKVARPLFRARKKVEKLLHKTLPGLYLPLYNMISFSNIPYADARDRARRQDRAITWGALILAALILITIGGLLWS